MQQHEAEKRHCPSCRQAFPAASFDAYCKFCQECRETYSPEQLYFRSQRWTKDWCKPNTEFSILGKD